MFQHQSPFAPFHPGRENFPKPPFQLTISSSSQLPVIVKSTDTPVSGPRMQRYTLLAGPMGIAAHDHRSICFLSEDDRFIVVTILAQFTLPRDLQA